MNTCAACHQEKPIVAKGLCKRCYSAQWRAEHLNAARAYAASYQREWRAKHPEEYAEAERARHARRVAADPEGMKAAAKERSHKHYLNNKEDVKERARLWHLANIEKAREACRRWRAAHGREWYLKWKAEHPEEYQQHSSAHRLRMRIAEGHFTVTDIQRIFVEQGGFCANPACDESLEAEYDIDHKIPLSQPGTSNWPHNIQLLCPPCNGHKGNRIDLGY
jgi:5-methylcytosine-specific restriction endonuclease McrA